jgi:hypothetical protein
MQLLDVARRKMLHQQHLLKEAELHRLDDEIRKKVCLFFYLINKTFIYFI